MSIIYLDWETAHLHGEAWISHHRLRYRLFVERQQWRVPNVNGLEYDQFDTPAARYVLWVDDHGQTRGVTRLVPTTRPYMVQMLWPDLVEGELPCAPFVWEATRFGCDQYLDPALRRQIVHALICGCLEFGLMSGITKLLCVMPLGIFRNVIQSSGCSITLLGPAKQIGRHRVAAAYIEVSAEVLARIRRKLALGEVLMVG
jgi:N-acyl-L-homoserine lactone synthetase